MYDRGQSHQIAIPMARQIGRPIAVNEGGVIPPPFSPLDVSGCVLWLDAQDTGTITLDTSGGRDSISQWNDKSGGARHFTQATKANQPTYQATSALKSLPGAVFVSANQYSLVSTAGAGMLNNAAGCSIFIAMRLDAIPATEGRMFSLCETGSTVNTRINATVRSTSQWRIGDKRTDGTSGDPQTTGTAAATTNYVYLGLMDCAAASNQLEMYINGASVGTKTWIHSAGNFSNTDSGDVRIGGRLADRWLDGVIGEMLIYNNVISASNRSAILSYLNTRWGTIY